MNRIYPLAFVVLIFLGLYLVADFTLGTHSYSDRSWSFMPSELIIKTKDGSKIEPIRWKYIKNWDGYLYFGLYHLDPFESFIDNARSGDYESSYEDIAEAENFSGSLKELWIESFSGNMGGFTPDWFPEQKFEGKFSYSGDEILFPPSVGFMEFYVSYSNRVVGVIFHSK